MRVLLRLVLILQIISVNGRPITTFLTPTCYEERGVPPWNNRSTSFAAI